MVSRQLLDKLKKYRRQLSGMTFVVLVVAIGFQNCQNQKYDVSNYVNSHFSSEVQALEVPTPITHPGSEPARPTVQNPMMAHRQYVWALLTEVYGAEDVNLEKGATNSTLFIQPGSWGFPCNPKGQYAATDCGGTTIVPMFLSGADTIRAATKAQACLFYNSDVTSLKNIMSKIVGSDVSPDLKSIQSALDLFYRGDDENLILQQQLKKVDEQAYRESIEAGSELSIEQRWRLLLLAICESSGWELL